MSDTGRMGQDVTYAVFLEPAWKNGQKSDVEYSRPSEKEEREKQDLAPLRYAEMRGKIQCGVYGLQNCTDVPPE